MTDRRIGTLQVVTHGAALDDPFSNPGLPRSWVPDEVTVNGAVAECDENKHRRVISTLGWRAFTDPVPMAALAGMTSWTLKEFVAGIVSRNW